MEHMEHKGKMAEVVDPKEVNEVKICNTAMVFRSLLDNNDSNTLLNLMYLLQDSCELETVQWDKITKDEARKIIWKLIVDNGDFGYVEKMKFFMVLANYNLFDTFIEALTIMKNEDFKNIF